MQRMPIVLESRYCLLHLRASLERKCSQPRLHPIHIEPSLKSKLCHQNYVIKKGRPHGHRYGKTEEQRYFHIALKLRKRCIKRRFQGIHDRFLKHPEFRESQLEHDRDEEVCIKMDELAQKRFLPSYDASRILSIQKELVNFSQ